MSADTAITTSDKTKKRIMGDAERNCALIDKAVAIVGTDWEFAGASMGRVYISADNGLSDVRRFRRAIGRPITDRRIYPYTADSTRAHLSIHFLVGDFSIVLSLEVDDYRRYLKPGANCRVVSQSNVVECGS